MKSMFNTILLIACCTSYSIAQSGNLLNRTKEKVKSRTEQKTDNAIDRGLDKLEEGINSIFEKKNKESDYPTPAPANNTQQGKIDYNSSSIQSSSTTKSSGGDTDFSQYKGSSFIPGKNVIFFEDFSSTSIGAGSNNWHIYEYDPADDIEKPSIKSISGINGKWLKMPRKGFAFPNGFKNLPEQFTIEYDLYCDPSTMSEMEGGFRTNFVAKDDREEYSIYWSTEKALSLDVHPHGKTKFVNILASTEYNPDVNHNQSILFNNTYKSGWKPGQVNRVSIYRNGKQVILYVNGQEYLNLANGLPNKAQYNLIFSTNQWGDGSYVSNIRVAADVPNATKEIQSSGKFVTNAIYFDVNSSRIKPESWATLNNAAQAIKATSEKILIVGHTDSDGSDQANLKLSQTRAEAVKQALVREFGIESSRLITDGKGESQPVSSNNTASGKAQNRRVEFIKQ